MRVISRNAFALYPAPIKYLLGLAFPLFFIPLTDGIMAERLSDYLSAISTIW